MRGLALRKHGEIIDSFHNGNFLGIIELLSKNDLFLATHIEKYGSKRHRSTSYLSHSIYDELTNIAKSAIKIILKDAQDSRYFSISVDSTPDTKHTDQLCITFRYLLPSGPVESFVTVAPSNSYARMGKAEVILTFLQENLIDVKYCRCQSYDNARSIPSR